jgi:hypothetical protein
MKNSHNYLLFDDNPTSQLPPFRKKLPILRRFSKTSHIQPHENGSSYPFFAGWSQIPYFVADQFQTKSSKMPNSGGRVIDSTFINAPEFNPQTPSSATDSIILIGHCFKSECD